MSKLADYGQPSQSISVRIGKTRRDLTNGPTPIHVNMSYDAPSQEDGKKVA